MKQFLRHIFLLLALFMATANAWAADCTIIETHNDVTAVANGGAFSYKPFGQINLCSTRYNLKILSISMSIKMDNEGTQGFEGVLKTNNGETLGECKVNRNTTNEYTFQVNKSSISSFILDASDKKYSKKRTVQISNIKVVYECAPSFDDDVINITLDDTPVGQTSTRKVTIGYESTATTVTLQSSEVSDDKGFFSISPSTKSVTTGRGTVEYAISFAPTSSVQGATAQYIIKGEGETKVTINVTGTSFDVVAPIHTWKQGVATTYKVGDPDIDLKNIWTSKSSGSITYRIKKDSFKPSGVNNEGATPPSINGNVLTLGQAGTLVIEMVQDATTGFYAKTSEQTITINKYNVEASISQLTAVWNEIIDNPFSLSYGLIDFDVESKNTNIADYHKDTKKIQTYFTDGTASFQITRPEDYKYNALSKILTLDVNQSTVNCLVLEDADQRNWETINNSGIYTIPSGTPESLFFQARRTDILGFTNTTEFYAEYSSDNNTWTEAMKINLPDQGTWYDLKCDIPETAKYVRFITYTGATGNKHIRNVCVTRKTYLRPSVSSLALPQTTKGKPVSASFNLDWSTCSDEIVLLSTNTNFVLSKSSIDATSGCGTATITVTYDANSGSQSGTIVIYDQSQKIEIPVSCEVKAKLATEIIYTGEATYPDTPDGILYPFYVKDENGNTVQGAAITLATSNEDILSFDANKIYPHCGGNVTLTATYAGDNTHEPCSLSIPISVPYCQREIVWNTSYLNFATDENGYIDDKRALNATINPQSAITYQLHTVTSTPFAEIIEENGTHSLRVFGEGRGYIVAIANECLYEGQMYETTYKIKELRVSGAGACDPNSLLIWEGIENEPFVYQFSTNSSERTRIYHLTGLPAATMTFGAHAASASLNSILVISFSTESEGNNWIGEHRQEVVSGSSYKWDYSCPVPAGAKRVRFQSEASLTIYFNGVTIPQQTYIRPSVESIEISDAIVNVPFERTFSVDYSNVRLLQWTITNNHNLGLEVVANQEVNNDCGLYGSYSFTLKGESPYPQENVKEIITFFTSAGDEVEIPVTITAALSEPFYFNVTENGDWKTPTNWTHKGSTSHGMIPDKRFPVVISKPLTINEGELVAYGITIEEGVSVNIQPTGGLTLHAGGFTSVTENNFEVQNNLEGAGYVRVSQYFKKLGGTMPKMKVHFTTKANMNNGENKDAAWQYIGAPGAETQMQVVNTSTLYLRSEEKGWVRQWDSNASLTPFAGYAFTQKDQPSIDFTPRLLTEDQTITLTYTEDGMQGDNLWANSYMAPIDIKKLGKEDFSGNVDQIVYLYNCGSWNEWNTDQNAISSAEILPGRYYAIPVGSARALDATYDQTVIPPMQGVYMVAKSGGGSLTLNYEKHVWNCTSDKMNQALRIAGKHSSDEDYLSSILRIRLQVNSQNSGADRMYLIQDSTCTADYDNGFDAPKQMTEGLLNFYTNEACGQMEISAADNIDGIYLGFAAGEDEVYTMTFTSLIGEDLYLYDVEQDTLIGMSNGDTYEFAAVAKSVNDMRFQILVDPALSDYQPNTGNGGDVTTNLNDVPMQQLWVHDDKVYISHASTNSILEVYTVSGMPVTKYAIGYAPCILDLSDIPTGVYMLRLNDQVYKFVCK